VITDPLSPTLDIDPALVASNLHKFEAIHADTEKEAEREKQLRKGGKSLSPDDSGRSIGSGSPSSPFRGSAGSGEVPIPQLEKTERTSA